MDFQDKRTSSLTEETEESFDPLYRHEENGSLNLNEKQEDKDQCVDIINVKPRIKVTIDSITPPVQHVDTPRPKLEKPEFIGSQSTEPRGRDADDRAVSNLLFEKLDLEDSEKDKPRPFPEPGSRDILKLDPPDGSPGLCNTPLLDGSRAASNPDDVTPVLSDPCLSTSEMVPPPDSVKMADSLPSEPCVTRVEKMESPSESAGPNDTPMVDAAIPVGIPRETSAGISDPCLSTKEVLAPPEDFKMADKSLIEETTSTKPHLPSEPCVAKKTIRFAPDSTQQDQQQAGVEEGITTERQPECALLFAMIMSAHAYLGFFCLLRWLCWGDNGYVMIPMFLMSFGPTVDNYRIFRGVLLGVKGLDSSVTSLSYLLTFSALPLLWISLAEIFTYQTGWWLVTLPARVLAVAFCVSSFNAFLSQVQGHYTIASDGGVWRHTLDPFKVPYQLMIQPVLLAVAGLFLGFLNLCVYGDTLSFLVQVLAFFGQALATREPRSGQYITNALEFVYLASVLYMYMIQV